MSNMAKIKLDGYRCECCEHQWVPCNKDEKPLVCPKCKNPYWNKRRTTGGAGSRA